MVNVLIINYNTQKLTNACICSVNKFTPDATIYVFDNSDKEPFVNTHKNVQVLDNTKSQIIDFNTILNKYENKTSYGAKSNFGTLKHCLSVDKCFDLINDNFILLDSDVLVKKDLTEIYDDKYIYVGDVFSEGLSKNLRLSPHVCFINVNKSKENNIRYFDEKRIVGLSKEGDDYDTGSSFYFDTVNFDSRKIKERDYIIHFGAASWSRKDASSINTWLKNHSILWDNKQLDKNKKYYSSINSANIFICTHKEFEPIVHNEAYKTINAREIEPKLPLKDDFYSELYQFKYVADNLELPKYIGFCHYRRYFSFLDDIPNMDEIFSNYDAICSKPKILKGSVKEQYITCHSIEDLYIIGGIIAEKYPEQANMWKNFINGNILIPYNMFIMKREDFKEYIDFIFSILDEYLKIVGTDINKRIYDNYEKYIKKFYPNNSVEYQYRIGGYIAERLTNLFIMHKFKKMKTYPVIVTEDKYKQNKKDNP